MKVQITCLDSEGMEWSYRGADGCFRFLDFQDMTYKVGSHVSPINSAAKGSVKERIVADVGAARNKWLAPQRAKGVPPPTIRRIDDEGNLWGYREQSWFTGEARLDFAQSIYINTDGRKWDFGQWDPISFCQEVLNKVTIERDKWLAAQKQKQSWHAVEDYPEPACQDEPIPGYVEETWIAKQPFDFAEIVPDWTEDLAGIQNAEARLRASITRNERWPFCPTCQQNRRLAYDYEESETDHRLITKVTAFWTCTEEGEEDE